MNIYSLNPIWLKDNALDVIISILKVKKVYCFISSENYKKIKNVELHIWDGCDLEEFLKKCVYDFVNIISEPLYYKGEFIGERYVKDMFKGSLPLNPIYNVENLDDPNILVLYNPEEPKLTKRGILSMFKNYSMNILNKYGNIDYLDRICFYIFDSYLSKSFIYKKKCDLRGEIKSVPVVAIISRYNETYDPLLSYLFLKSNDILEGSSVQERFLKKEGIIRYETQIINNYNDYLDPGDIPDDDGFERACKAEMEYIINNGGDWIYD